MPITHIADHYLDAFRNGTPIEGGLAFQKALMQANLDFSVESLDRLDALLLQIREKLRPEFDAFIGKHENQNFLYAIAFYAGEVIARHMQWKRHWLQYPELMEVMKGDARDYPQCFATSISCYFESGALFLPLSSMQERLFEPSSTRSLSEAAKRYMQTQESLKLERSRAVPTMLPGPTAAEIKALAAFAGLSAAFAVFQIAEGATLIPTLANDMPNGERLMEVLMRNSLEEAVSEGQQRLAANSNGARRMTLAVDGYTRLPSGRNDALLFEARSFVEPGIVFGIAVPYRPASSPGGFAVYNPRLLSLSADAAHVPLLAASFFSGFDKFNPQGLWHKYFDASL